MPKPGPGSPHGIYKYKDGDWILVRREGRPLSIGEDGDGTYIIYFYNIKCPACRIFTPQWEAFTKLANKKLNAPLHIYIVLCEWFSSQCTSPAAASTFIEMDITSTPTVVIAKVSNGKVVDSTILPGYRGADDLLKIAKRYS
ncbi:MAG: thioredoxin family protein [Desulfurococcales archaeon]|nr:thioredoxin family protein [Desulfurococcales archaeon]